MLVLGLTGSAAMGKSTIAAMFAEAGAAVFDADRAVHALYRGAAVPLVEAAFPGTTADGAVDREKLRQRVLGDPDAVARLETLVHPLVRAEEEKFRAAAAGAGRRVVLLDVPLFFETGGETRVDLVIVASAPAAIQRARMLSRPGMNEERLAAMLARQLSDAEKRARAHFIIDTSGELSRTRKAVGDILRAVAPLAGGG